MVRDFEIHNPFAKSTEMFTGTLDLQHHVIAEYMRDKLSRHRDYTSYFNSEFNEKMVREMPLGRELENAIMAAGRLYMEIRHMNPEHFEGTLPSLWFSEYVEGDRHTLHNHPRALIAGTYYPYADEDSCEVRYRHPASTMLTMAEPWMCGVGDEVVHTIYKLKPKTGMINLWPSWMDHEIGPQGPVPRERSRLAISFNWGRLC